MTKLSSELTMWRILVALDASPEGTKALDTLRDLAEIHQAELLGLFVEDINLLRLGGLPFAREIVPGTQVPRRLETSDIERSLRGRADQARRKLEQMALGRKWNCSFQVCRGDTLRVCWDASQEVDLMILGLQSQFPRLPRPAVRSGAKQTNNVLLFFDGDAAGLRALNVAVGMVSRSGGELRMLVPPAVAREKPSWLEKFSTFPEIRKLGTRFHWLPGSVHDFEELLLLARREQTQALALVLDRNHPWLDAKSIQALVRNLEIPLLFVR